MASSTAKYVARKYPSVRKVFAIGMRSVRECLQAEGIEVIGADQPVLPPGEELSIESFDSYEIDRSVGAVVYGIDFSFTH